MKSLEVISGVFKEFQIIAHENNNQEYEGFVFTSKGKKYRSRLARKTSKKNGYFAAYWTKNHNKNIPFDAQDNIDYLVITVIDGNNKGLFTIPKEVLIVKKVLTTETNIGKMANRFYPSWCSNLNKTALKTQEWQIKYFTDLTKEII